MVAAPVFDAVGRSAQRVEGPDKVTGRTQYTADFARPGLLWAKNVRSPLPHARIVRVDTARARALPGVHAVLTAADVPARRIGRSVRDYEIFCSERVRYVGDVIGAVAAEDAATAEEAALLVDVEYEELPAVFDPLEALLADAPLVHPDLRSYHGFQKEIPAEFHNVCAYLEVTRGDLDAGFAQAEVVVEHAYATQLMHQGYIEPNSCIVEIGASGRVEVWAANKIPFQLKDQLATILGIEPSGILVHRVNIGGEFGAKANPFDVPAAYYLARATGRPIKFVNSYQEELIAASPRHPAVVTIRAGARRDGTVTAWHAQVVFNSGAYGGLKPPLFNGNLGGSNNAPGWWTIPNVHIESRMVYTNTVPGAYMRAPGQPQAVFAAEAHMDRIARELQMDPLELRLRNLPSRAPDGGEAVVTRVLRAAADAIDWSHPRPRFVGRGIGLGARGTGAGASTSDLTLNPDGTLRAVSSVPDSGSSGLTVIAQMLAEVWGVPIESVHMVHGDTDSVPVDVGTGGSSITNSAGHAALAASQQLQDQLAPLAAAMLGSETAHWDGHGWASAEGRSVGLVDLVGEMLAPGDARAHAQVTWAPERSPDQQYCAQAAEVEVDPETGQVHVLRIASAQDVGTIINPVGHQGQIEGSVVQGVGYALIEELASDEGHITTTHLGDYKLPSDRDIPPLITINIQTTGPGPFNATGIGETTTVPTAAAIANAVGDAIGAPIDRLPITADRVLEALSQA